MMRFILFCLPFLLGPVTALSGEIAFLNMTRSEPLADIKITSGDGAVSIVNKDYSVTTHFSDGNVCLGTYTVSKKLIRIDNVVKWLIGSADRASESVVKIYISYKKCQLSSDLEGTFLSFVAPAQVVLDQALKNTTIVTTADGERGVSQTQYVFSVNK